MAITLMEHRLLSVVNHYHKQMSAHAYDTRMEAAIKDELIRSVLAVAQTSTGVMGVLGVLEIEVRATDITHEEAAVTTVLAIAEKGA